MRGHFLGDGPDICGRIVVKDIGLSGSPGPETALQGDPALATRLITRDSIPDLAKGGAHKYDHGHVLVISGGPGRTGAARLAARSALRMGAGLVTLACPLRALPEVAAQVTAVMLRGLDGPSGLAEMLEDVRFNAICLGPGLGLTQVTADLVRVALETGRPCVLDADALSRFQRAPEGLFDMLHPAAVLTPHGGEFARLFPDIADRLQAPAKAGPAFSRVDAAREAAARAGCVVILKGPDTVIADPDGHSAVHSAAFERAAPWLATAGAGDVLAGLIAGLLARGFAPMQAAPTAAWLHVECARRFGPGLIAEDLAEQLPNVLSDLRGSG
jgi:ADP-dependent NAD(P)H-hydrate dehydratase / NAD(P)H-hydrate epimerase